MSFPFRPGNEMFKELICYGDFHPDVVRFFIGNDLTKLRYTSSMEDIPWDIPRHLML